MKKKQTRKNEIKKSLTKYLNNYRNENIIKRAWKFILKQKKSTKRHRKEKRTLKWQRTHTDTLSRRFKEIQKKIEQTRNIQTMQVKKQTNKKWASSVAFRKCENVKQKKQNKMWRKRKSKQTKNGETKKKEKKTQLSKVRITRKKQTENK